MKKCIFSILMMIVITSIMFTSLPKAVAKAASTTISIAEISGNAGDIISIPVKISGNTGFCDFGFFITYDNSAFIPNAIISGDVWKTDLVTNLKYGNNTIMVLGSGMSNKTQNGIIFTIEFTVKDSAKDGKYEIKLTSDSFNKLSSDYTLNKVNVTLNSGIVQVGKDGTLIGAVNSSTNKVTESVTADTQTKSYEGALQSNTDSNVFEFILPYDSKVSLNFKHDFFDDKNPHWNVWFLDIDSQSLSTYMEISGNGTNQSSENLYLKKGKYQIKVEPNHDWRWSNQDYIINVNYQKNNGLFESETNDSLESANKISSLNTAITGNISSGNDYDYYLFNLQSAGKVNITFMHEFFDNSDEFWIIKLIDGNSGEKIMEFTSTGNHGITESPHSVYIPKGKYYVCIEAFRDWRWTNRDYRFSLNFFKNNGEYEIESNDSLENMNKITIGKPITGNILNGYDVDFYTFTLTKKSQISINFKHSYWDNNDDYWVIDIINANSGKKIHTFTSTGSSINVTSTKLKLEKGKYAIRISPSHDWRWSWRDYTLKVNLHE